jgi:hypothetical protein
MMPGLQDRRVHRLRLTAAANDDLWRCRVLLEDAFHTASLPGIPAGRLILVKQFSIGQLSTQQSSAALSKVIDDNFRELASQAVPADHPSAASRSVVYFRDEVEPLVKLAVRIAANQETSSWFWPLAAKGWRPTMSKREGLRALLFQVAESRAGPAGVVALVGELHQLRLLEPLLANLETTDSSRLMQLCGWSEPVAGSAPQSVRDIGISGAAQTVLTAWVKRWNPVDVRSIWLAAVFLVEQKPVRLLDQKLMQRAVSLVEVLSNKSSSAELFATKAKLTSEKDISRSTRRAESTASSDLDTRHGISERGEQVSNKVDASLHSHAPEASQLGVNKGREAFDEFPHRRHEAAPADFAPGTDRTRPETDRARNVKRNRLSPGDNSSNTSSLETSRSSERVFEEGIRETSDTPDRLQLSRSAKPETIPEILGAIETAEGSRVDLNYAELKPAWVDDSKATEFGGFYFLLGLMSRLHVGDFLERHPRLIEFDFPKRLLRFAAGQLKIPEADPVMMPFRELENGEDPAMEFSVPQIWREQLYHSGALLLSNIAGRPGYRMLTDRSGRSVLSIWRGRAPESVRSLIGTSVIARVSARRCEDNSRALLTCWHRALVRWSRCFGRIGLDHLVRRRGVLSVSRTHLDLFFDLNSVDTRIRRAGLDLNPGWLPWFGRVVSFHYLEKEEIDGRK